MPFEVTNRGDRAGTITLEVELDEIGTKQREVQVLPDDAINLTAPVTFPDDLGEGRYQGIYRMIDEDGTKLLRGVVLIDLDGVSLTVDASIDDRWYLPGEAATVTRISLPTQVSCCLTCSQRPPSVERRLASPWQAECHRGRSCSRCRFRRSQTSVSAGRSSIPRRAMAPGVYTFRVVFVSGTHREERTLTLVYGSALADLAVSLWILGPEFDEAGNTTEPPRAIVTVRNQGVTDAGAFEAVLERVGSGGGTTLVGTIGDVSLAAGESVTESIDLPVPGNANVRTYRATAQLLSGGLEANAANDIVEALLAVPRAPSITVAPADPDRPWAGIAASWSAAVGDAGPATYDVMVTREDGTGAATLVLPLQSFGGITSTVIDDVPMVVEGDYRVWVQARNALGFAGPLKASAVVGVAELIVPVAATGVVLLAMGWVVRRKLRDRRRRER